MSIIDAVTELDIGAISLLLGLISIGILAICFIKANIDTLQRQNETPIEQNKTALAQNGNAIKSERNKRFKNAIEQLGSDKNAVVLDGIYTLHRIAKEDDSYIENVFNVLCSFVRDTTKVWYYQSKYHEKPSEPIQTILNILCRSKEDLKIYRTVNLFVDFYGAYLRSAYLRNANLTGAILYDVNLTGADLHEATLTGVFLYKATLTGANLSEAILTGANLAGADLMFATLTGAYLMDATLTGADLYEATLTGADLHEATLTGADLSEAILTGTDLMFATLTGAYSSFNFEDYSNLFEERIKSRIGKETDLSGIKGRYDPINPPFIGKPKDWDSYTKEEAEEIIKKYKDSRAPKSIRN